MCDKGHKFEKFDEDKIFCRRCGEFKTSGSAYVAPYQYPHYVPVPYRAYPPYPTFVWCDTGTTTTTIDNHTYEVYS